MESADNIIYYPLYDGFKVANEIDNYRLSVGNILESGLGASVPGGKGGFETHNNIDFSTMDDDNDNAIVDCSNAKDGGWWFDSCYKVHLNGVYGPTNLLKDDMIVWDDITQIDTIQTPFVRTRMMFRKDE